MCIFYNYLAWNSLELLGSIYIYRFHYICKIWDRYLIFSAYSHPFLGVHFIYVRYLVVWEVTRLCSIFFNFFRRLRSVRNILFWKRDGDFQKLERCPLFDLLWSAWEMSWQLWVCHVARVLYNEHIMGPEVYWKSYFLPSWACCCSAAVTSVVSNSVWPHRWQPTRLPHPWNSPGKNTGVGCHFLLQNMKVKSESEVAQSCLTLSDPMDCSLPGSSVHGIFQARVLEWAAIASSYLGPSRF